MLKTQLQEPYSPQVCARILQRTEKNMRKFSALGIEERLDVISFENVEYIAKLHAIEREQQSEVMTCS